MALAKRIAALGTRMTEMSLSCDSALVVACAHLLTFEQVVMMLREISFLSLLGLEG